ncbi:MAG: TonB-dependent receptor [Pedobacter sp.]
MTRTIALYMWLVPCICYSQIVTKPVKHTLDSLHNLQEVVVKSNILKIIKESPGNVTVVDVKPYYNSNITPVQILRQTSGIKVKQDGGYGSRVDFFVNGSTGKQIKFFLDGLPLDNLGETQGVNNLPLEQIERIEVYKSVLPIELGVDALGGAINIITRKERINYIDASYALSSFNTHRLNFAGKKFWSEKFYTSLIASGGYSDNNYKITVGIPNQNYNLETREVERFHDRYKNQLVKAEAGIVNISWADQLALTLSRSELDKQLQHNLIMTQPYGKATYHETLYNALLKYQKNNLFKGISLISQSSFNRVNGVNVDTSQNIYIWNGNVFDRRLKPDEGELEKAKYLNIYTNIINQRTMLSWRLSDQYKISFINTFQHYRRTGKDTLSQSANYGIDFFGKPSVLLKNIGGIGFDGTLFNNKLRLSTSVKHFYAEMSSYELVNNQHIQSLQNIKNITYNAALTYPLNNNILLKTSFEHALRLPDVEEAFGNLMLIKPNPNLKPESSDNLNLNVLINEDKIDAEITGFYRNVQDLIFLETNTRGNGMSKNLNSARIKGIEAAANYHLNKALDFNCNATYQDLRNRGTITGDASSGRYVNSRIPNIPYFIANSGINYNRNRLFNRDVITKLWLNLNYTHEYFLYWEVDGDKNRKNLIPSQFLQNAGISCSFKNNLTFTFESYNLSNQKTYDNFNVQLPGRSFSLKTRFYISKTQRN